MASLGAAGATEAPRGGAAWRRREQRRRQTGRQVTWLLGVVQSSCSHHTASTPSLAAVLAAFDLLRGEVESLRTVVRELQGAGNVGGSLQGVVAGRCGGGAGPLLHQHSSGEVLGASVGIGDSGLQDGLEVKAEHGHELQETKDERDNVLEPCWEWDEAPPHIGFQAEASDHNQDYEVASRDMPGQGFAARRIRPVQPHAGS